MQAKLLALLRNRIALAAVLAVLALAAVAVAVLALGGGDQPTRAAPELTATPGSSATATATTPPTATPEASPTPIKHAGILDGFPMTDDEWEARKDLAPLAVMLDNTTGAYPHAGLDKADLVYEAFVEGGLTRLMAVYWRQDAGKILPVRSARTPFVVWVSELSALYAYAGGAQTDNEANAIGQVFEWKVAALNAFAPVSSNAFYRDQSRKGPYDLATSTTLLRKAAGQLGLAPASKPESWRFREPGTRLPAGQPAGGIEINFNRSLYSWQYIQWKWDAVAKRYVRFQFGGPHIDVESGHELAFATVIVMQAPAHVVDESGHVLIDQLGTGPATVFTGGLAYPGTWKKDSRESRTRFFTSSGEEVVFERGPVFIEVIAQQSSFAFTAASEELPPMPEYVPPPPGSFVPESGEPEPEPEPTATATAPAAATPVPSPEASPTRTQPPTPSLTPTRTPTPENTPTPSPVP